ncbi:MAG: phospholipase D family protein [Pseudomonadota bacterium]
MSLVLLVLVSILGGCAGLPSLEDRPVSAALTETGSTRLGRAIAPQVAAHPGRSGIHPLLDARDAFAARLLLAQHAERSLDVQYYLWRLDQTGTQLFDALRAAADRGVRVRLLLDDGNHSLALDDTLAALDGHAHIEVRLFNPFPTRGLHALGYLADFPRLNRRMHNKSFTADNQASVIGGRNIGDEYFGNDADLAFIDLDVLAIGPVVSELSRDFDRYWASASAYPIDRLLAPAPPAALDRAKAPAQGADGQALADSEFARRWTEGTLKFEWAVTHLVSDDPAKGLDRSHAEAALAAQLTRVLGAPARQFDLVSPYFVPTRHGTRLLTELAGRGVRVRVLTNALEATDVSAVHAGYAKRRKTLLKSGITLYEWPRRLPKAHRASGAFASGNSRASLHAKTFAVDNARLFVGSFNFDPRSARLNTELGLVIESPALASGLTRVFDRSLPALAYEARLDAQGQLYWIDRRGAQETRRDSEPGATLWRRAWLWLITRLPVEWLL